MGKLKRTKMSKKGEVRVQHGSKNKSKSNSFHIKLMFPKTIELPQFQPNIKIRTMVQINMNSNFIESLKVYIFREQELRFLHSLFHLPKISTYYIEKKISAQVHAKYVKLQIT